MLSLKKLLKADQFPKLPKGRAKEELKLLQLRMLRIQEGIWHQKKRAIILFEGFDAAGKGGAIRAIIEKLDPRGAQVHPIGPPTEEEKGKHYLYRFWNNLPPPGSIALFDRSWYGRVLVEKVERLAPPERIKDAYGEINEFEEMLIRDGIDVIKIFLGISKSEQFKRFDARLKDPYKQWKLTPDDLRARSLWNAYVEAVDLAFKKTHTHSSPWHLIPANHKHFARVESLKIITKKLKRHEAWMEEKVQLHKAQAKAHSLEIALKELGRSIAST